MAMQKEIVNMIDRIRRDQYAEQLRHFAAGVLTVDEYEWRTDDFALTTQDPALSAVWERVWGLYDDFRTDRLRDEWKLDAATRQCVARSILFLYSDAEYRWPADKRRNPIEYLEIGTHILLNVITVGLWNRLIDPVYERRQQEYARWLGQFGDFDCWPFLSRAELDMALQRPRFFARGVPKP
jgi:hypothetical protein